MRDDASFPLPRIEGQACQVSQESNEADDGGEDEGDPHRKLVVAVEGRSPELDEVRERVAADAEREEIESLQEEAIQAIVDTYEVRRSL